MLSILYNAYIVSYVELFVKHLLTSSGAMDKELLIASQNARFMTLTNVAIVCKI